MSDLQYALLLNQVADLAANGLIRFLTSKTIILHRQTLVFSNKIVSKSWDHVPVLPKLHYFQTRFLETQTHWFPQDQLFSTLHIENYRFNSNSYQPQAIFAPKMNKSNLRIEHHNRVFSISKL